MPYTGQGCQITQTLHDPALALHQQTATSAVHLRHSPVLVSPYYMAIVLHLVPTLRSCSGLAEASANAIIENINCSKVYKVNWPGTYQPINPYLVEVTKHEETAAQTAFVDDYLCQTVQQLNRT